MKTIRSPRRTARSCGNFRPTKPSGGARTGSKRSRRSKAGCAKRRAELRNEHRLDADALAARVGSTSYLPKTGAAAGRLRDEVRALFARHARDGAVVMVMRTIVVAGDVGAG